MTLITPACERCKSIGSRNWYCPNISKCPFFDNVNNVIINRFNDTNNEFIVYNREFNISGNPNISDIDRSRKYYYDERGFLCSKSGDGIDYTKLQDTLRDSRKRTLDNFFGYANTNDWKYFFTLTFDPNKIVDTKERDIVLYCFKLFRQKIQYRFPDVTIIAVLEKHKLGGIHFHGFIGNCTLTKYMRRAFDTKKYLYEYDYINQCKLYKLDKQGNKIYNKHYNQPLTDTYVDGKKIKHHIPVYTFNDDFFSDGYSTIVEIEPGSKVEHISGYLSKYFSKDLDGNTMYNKRAYFHTSNLMFKQKTVQKLSENKIAELVKGLPIKKQTDKFTIYTFTKEDWARMQGLEECLAPDVFNSYNQMKMDDLDAIF